MYLESNQTVTLYCGYGTNDTADLNIWKLFENGVNISLGARAVNKHGKVSARLETSADRLFDGVGNSSSIVTFCQVIPYVFINSTYSQSDPENYNFTCFKLKNETADLNLTMVATGDFIVMVLFIASS